MHPGDVVVPGSIALTELYFGVKSSFSSVQLLGRVQLFVTPWTDCSMPGLPVHHQLPEFTQTHIHRVGDAIQSAHPLSFPSPAFPASGSFPVIQFFISGGQSIGVSASASVLPVNIQDWFPLGWTGWTVWTVRSSAYIKTIKRSRELLLFALPGLFVETAGEIFAFSIRDSCGVGFWGFFFFKTSCTFTNLLIQNNSLF